MMNDLKKILNAGQIRNADNHTISNKPIPSIDLMEYASNCFVNSIWDKQFITKKIAVVCGTGNNGGDGLAISRLLKEKKVSVKTYFLNISSKISKDCQLNLTKLGSVEELTNSDSIPNFSKYDLIIDAIFGTGLSKPVGGYYTRIIDSINSQECSIYSVDIPSGMYCDKISDSKHIINADLTVSFQ
ncbi:MAG TPA: NAD(P)H-hydrate epimerase, partial [Candidatus Marinimicrobia bacterium]|nr:NAD(P)H-hydrate epimerase [Candidatus Neomarinimicrobiota bacterium]